MASKNIQGITIEIDGNTKPLSSALREVDSALKDTQSELSSVERALKFDPANIDLLRDKFMLMGDRIADTKSRLETLEDAQRQLDAEGVDKNSQEYQALQVEIDTTKSKLKGLEDQTKEFGSVGAQKIKAVGEQLKDVGGKITDVGKNLTTHLTLPIVAAGGAAVKMASDYDENLNKVDVAFQESSDVVKEWAKTATDSFGLSENDALEAAALFGDMGTAMGLTTEDAADMSTSLAGLAGDLASFKNVDIEQAMTALKGVFTGETESLKNLGVVMTQTNLEEFADKQGLVYKEMSQAEKVALRYQYVLESTKNAQGDYMRTSDGAANSFRTMQASLENLGVAFGTEILPYVVPVIQAITDLIKQFSELDEGTKKIIITVLAVAAAIGPVLVVIGSVVSAIGTIMTVISTLGPAIAAIGGVLMGPVGIILLIIAAVAALAAAIYLNWDKIKEWTAELGRKIAAFGEDVKKGWENLKADASQKWNDIKNTVNSKVSDAVTSAKNKWNEAKEATGRLWGAMKSEVEKNGGGIKGFLKTSADGWKQFIVNAWEKADEKTGGALSNMLSKVTTETGKIKDKIEEKIGAAVDFIKDLPRQALQWGKDLISNFIDGIKNAPANLASAASDIAGTIKDFIGFSEPDKGPLSNFHTFAPDMIDLFAKGIENSIPTLARATSDMASALVPGMGAVQNGTTNTATTYNTPVNITVYGAQGQDVNALADVIQARLNRAVVNQKAVFA